MRSSRRDFLAALAVTGVGAFAPGMPGVREALAHAAAVRAGVAPARFDVLTAAEAAAVTAVAARIVPTTETPGATEAGVVHFIDYAFGDFAKDGLADFRAGLADLDTRATARRATATPFASLPAADQDAILADIEQTPFFGGLRAMTMMGMFTDPRYGGNRDEVGWKLIGFENAMSHTAPFGYYDAEAAKGRD
ncbi:MAG: gluconate 2-dehydrogenase subunit 3 family protein [Gemmatimonadota bacterium]|nr:gluconate 2-dehydrogenase subunit 3 family protein [Gemmatimonadota bacterium]